MRNWIFVLLLAVCADAKTGVPGYSSLILAKGKVAYRLKPSDRIASDQYCSDGVCTCDSDIQYIQIHAPTPVNSFLKNEAARTRCRYADLNSITHQSVTSISRNLVSVISHFFSLPLGAGGSCHSGAQVHTFNLRTGREYILTDIVDPSALFQIRAALPASIVAEHYKQEDKRAAEAWQEEKAHSIRPSPSTTFHGTAEQQARDLEIAESEIDNLSDLQILKHQFFVQNKQVFIDISGYYFSCAEGAFHPAMIPQKLIKSAWLQQELATPKAK